jgi:hypothetical protein
LTEQHGDELLPAGKSLGVTLGGVPLHQRGKLRAREVLEQLIEQACDLYDWIALLWAACGEAPVMELLANVNYRRAVLSISDCKNLFWTRVKFDHPTQKPVELMRRPILNHTKRGELVYEPFLGSGTTLAAAELTERVCYGIELDPKYADVTVLRWQTLTGRKAVLESSGKTLSDVASERAAVTI